MLGSAVPEPVHWWVKVACGAVQRRRRWGGGGSLRQSSLDCVFINHPLKKYLTHRPGYLAPIKSLYSLRSCITFLYSLRSVVMIPFSFGYLNSLAPTGTGSSLRLGLLKEYK